eukprot:3269279-Rhodomonas_salina.2
MMSHSIVDAQAAEGSSAALLFGVLVTTVARARLRARLPSQSRRAPCRAECAQTVPHAAESRLG